MKTNLTYRSDIDGLRAVAVLLVVFYHAGFQFVTGGFIGVDVFFVLSGFLITFTINKEMSESTFSFTSFYLRRIRRIIPVLVFIMLVTTIPAYLFLFPEDLEAYSRTLLHTILSTNNFHLWIINSDYFTTDADLIPFLHTWSLSVEEQFYFLWPVLLVFLHKKFTLKHRLIFTFLLLILGIVLSIFLTNKDQNLAYYLIPARIFELMIGAVLALVWDKLPVLKTNFNHFVSIVGLLLILIPAFVLTKNSLFPGLNAFYPCFGTAILIFTGKNNNARGLINALLQNKAFVLVGLLSYSIYLWHWPVFVFLKYLGSTLQGSTRLVALCIIFVLSYLSWKFIEQPFRTSFRFNFKKTILVVFLPSIIVITSIYALFDGKDGFPDRFPNLKEFSKSNYPNKVRSACYGTAVGNCDECFVGIKKNKLDGVLLGDSFANHTAAFLDVLAKDAGLYIHDTAAPYYPLLTALDNNGVPIRPINYAEKRLEYAKQFEYIYIASSWELISNPDSKNHQLIVKTIKDLVALNKKIVIIDCLRTLSSTSLHKAKLVKSKNPTFFTETDFSISFKPRPFNYIIHEIKRKYPSILIIDLSDAVCHNGTCDIAINNTIIYKDGSHLTTSGAQLLAQQYLKIKGNPLKKF